MIYMYTNQPDEGCHEIEGVFGRPVFESEHKPLLAKGWKFKAEDVEIEAKEEISPELIAAYEAKFGKKPHHKMLAGTIAKALEDDQA